MRRWAEREEHLEADGKEVEHGVEDGNVLDLSILVLGWMQHAGVFNLLAPRDAFLLVDSFQELVKSLSLLFRLGILDNLNHQSVLLRDFNLNWLSIKDLNTEDFVSLFLIIIFALWNLDHDFLKLVATFESQSTFCVDVIFAWSRCAVRL